MKKYLAMLCAAMLCACCLGLAACGAPSASSSAASSEGSASASAEASASSAAADPAAKFVGTWKLAGAEMEGVTIAGDLSAVLGDALDMQIAIAEGGTGAIAFNGESVDFAWEAAGDDAIALTVAADEETAEDLTSALGSAGGDATLNLAYEDGALVMAVNEDAEDGKLFFTQDGTVQGAAVIDITAGTPITDESALVGDWKLAGMSMMGMSVYGDAETIAAMAGSTDMSLSLAAGGTGTLAGEEIAYTVGADGAAIGADGVMLPLLALGDGIALDMTEVAGLEMVLVYTK